MLIFGRVIGAKKCFGDFEDFGKQILSNFWVSGLRSIFLGGGKQKASHFRFNRVFAVFVILFFATNRESHMLFFQSSGVQNPTYPHCSSKVFKIATYFFIGTERSQGNVGPAAWPSRFDFASLPNVMMSPHSSSATPQTRGYSLACVVQNLQRFAGGGLPALTNVIRNASQPHP